MPSPLYVPVAQITSIAPHPNADSLDIAQVLGWQCVVRCGQYKSGDRIIYFPPDTVLPREVSDRFGVTNYLDKQRIKATRLRGEPSFGLVMPCDDEAWEIGQNVAEYYGAAKYEAPQRDRRGSKDIPNPDAQPRNPLFPEYTHVQNLRHFPDIFASDELVVVTEKLHGTNSRIGIVDGEWVAGSHRVQRGQGDALYWSPRSQPGVEAMITALAKKHRQVVLFGEILGSDVQSLDYGYKGHEGYAAFDLMVDGRFLDYSTFAGLCYHFEIPEVPLLHEGPFGFDAVRKLSKGSTMIAAVTTPCSGVTAIPRGKPKHLREGVVVRPIIERNDSRVGRVILKYVSDDYLLAKHSDFAGV